MDRKTLTLTKYSSLNKVHKNKQKSYLSAKMNEYYKQCYKGLLWDTTSQITQELFEDTGVGLLPNDWDYHGEMVSECRIRSTEEMLSEISISPEESLMNGDNSDTDSAPTKKLFGEDLVLFRRRLDQSQKIDHTTQISDEMLLRIFKRLDRSSLICCAKVCKRWRQVSSDEYLWNKIDLRKRYLKAGQLGHVINKNVAILRLNLATITTPIFDPEVFYDKSLRYSSLQYLDMSLANISKDGIAEVLSVCSRLRNLSLEACTLNEEVFQQLTKNGDLRVLNLSMCRELENTNFENYLSFCKSLISLNLAWIGVGATVYDDLVLNLSPGLQELNLSGARDNLSFKSLVVLTELCPNLKELDLCDAHNLGSLTIQVLVKNLPLLQKLHLSFCYSIPLESYMALSSLRYLKVLTVIGIFTEEALKILSESLPNVKINGSKISTIARPTRSNIDFGIWGIPLP